MVLSRVNMENMGQYCVHFINAVKGKTNIWQPVGMPGNDVALMLLVELRDIKLVSLHCFATV